MFKKYLEESAQKSRKEVGRDEPSPPAYYKQPMLNGL